MNETLNQLQARLDKDFKRRTYNFHRRAKRYVAHNYPMPKRGDYIELEAYLRDKVYHLECHNEIKPDSRRRENISDLHYQLTRIRNAKRGF